MKKLKFLLRVKKTSELLLKSRECQRQNRNKNRLTRKNKTIKKPKLKKKISIRRVLKKQKTMNHKSIRKLLIQNQMWRKTRQNMKN